MMPLVTVPFGTVFFENIKGSDKNPNLFLLKTVPNGTVPNGIIFRV